MRKISFKKFGLELHRLVRWLKKAGPIIVGLCFAIGVLFLLVGASHVAIQAATRSGHSVVGWVAVVAFWILLVGAGMGQSKASSGNDEKRKEDN